MILTLSTTHQPATDLGYLLHKHPAKVQTFEVAAGSAHVFYPRADDAQCTAALLLEVDPIALVRGRSGGRTDGGRDRRDAPPESFSLGQYVNDRPYAASSLLAVALGSVFRTALSGRCAAKPDLAASELPLQVHLPVLPCRGGAELARNLFEPLGWQVEARAIALDETMPTWGESRFVDLRLTGRMRLADALNHLYVLLPVLDDAKHYWVSPEEVDKLIRAGGDWLAGHPLRELITRRYLAHRRALTRTALDRLAETDDVVEDADAPSDQADGGIDEEPSDRPAPLAEQRRGAVLAVLHAEDVRRVGDLGCGSGALTQVLLADRRFTTVVAADVSSRALTLAERRLRLDRMPDHQRERLQLLQTSLTYRDTRLSGLDAIVLMEVIEHLDPPRLPALERAVFADAAPRVVVVTTPNIEHNVRYEGLAPGAFRHRDHRFEWTRAEFAAWAQAVATRRGYAVRYLPVGDDDPEVGPPTQLAVFTR